MTLIVETGTGSSTAESYCSVADATAYHAAMGNTAWASLASDTVREQLLRKATAYMEQIYGLNWSGVKKTTAQALSWPRSTVPIKDAPWLTFYADDAVPVQVKNACAELALKASTATLYADQTQGVVSETVGVISVTYDVNSSQRTRYSAVDAMLKPFLSVYGNAVEMVRV